MTRKQTLISVLAVMLALWPAGADAQKKKIEIERPEIKKPSKKSPEGAIVRGNKITLKSGYQFVKQSDNTVAVQSARSVGISGSYTCECYVQTGDCKLTIQKTSALCEGSCKDCRFLIVVDPPLKATPSKNAPVKNLSN